MKIKHLSLLTFMIALVFIATLTVKAAGEGFRVTRNVTGVANPVTNTFTYTVTNESGNPATITIPGTTTIAFNAATPSSNTATQSANPLIAEGAWTGAENWPGTSTKLSYTVPGTYKFKVAETGSTNATLYPKDTNYYIVTVFVENAVDGSNVPTGSLVKTYVGAQKNGTGSKIANNANAEFTSAAGGRSYLSISKQVKGNMANTDQCFSVTVALTAVTAGETYNVAGSSCSGNANITVGSGATTASATIKIKHGETVTIGRSGSINQLPVGAGYTITESAATGYDSTAYTTTINGTSGTTSGAKTVSATVSSNTYAFENTAQKTTPTGIIIRILPFLVLIVLSAVGIVAITKSRKLEQNEE